MKVEIHDQALVITQVNILYYKYPAETKGFKM